MRRVAEGSSSHFTVGAVVFANSSDAEQCSNRIDAIRKELGFSLEAEFRFSKTSARNRRVFFERVRHEQFFYFASSLDKRRVQSDTRLLRRETLYQECATRLFAQMQPFLKNAIVCFDRWGGRQFHRHLKSYLARRVPRPEQVPMIRRLKSAQSHGNNLLQLADMVCGAINRSVQVDKEGCNEFREIIRIRERVVETWP